MFEAVLARRDEWWVHAALARVRAEAGDTDAGRVHAADALLSPGDLPAKLQVIELVARILRDGGEDGLTVEHAALAARLRAERDWPVPTDIDVLAAAAADGDGGALATRLARVWRGWQQDDATHRTGVVKLLLAGGEAAGFITADDGRDVYVPLYEWHGPDRLTPGTRVTFREVPSYDRKKRRESTAAVDVRLFEDAVEEAG